VRLFNSQPLRRQIVVLTSVLLLFYAVVAVWASRRTLAEREAEVRDQAGALATTAGDYLNQYLIGVDSMASSLVRHQSVIALDRDACDRLFAAVLHDQPLLLNIVLSDTAGAVRGTGLPVQDGAAPPKPPGVSEVAASGRPVVTEFRIGSVTGKPTIILAYPVRDAREVLTGVLGLGLNLAQFQTLFRSIPLPGDSVVTMTDGKGRVLARSREVERFIGKAAMGGRPLVPSAVPRITTVTGLDGVERFWGNAVIERGPWVLSVGIPTSVAAARAAPALRRNLAIALVVSVVITLLALWGSQLISGGLNRLRAAAQRIADGDLTPPVRTVEPNLELAQLQDAFITMASNLLETRGALDQRVEQERKMREALQSLQRQVVRQERLAAVGVLVSGVAHELNNPLQAILGTLELLERDRGLAPEVLEEIAFVKTQSGRAREIIRNLSRFSSQQPGPPALVDLREVIDEVAQLRRREMDTSGIAFGIDVQTPRKVYANFTEVEQVTLNFVINAQQSIEAAEHSKGRILIRVSDAGKRVRLEVQDDGPGVTLEDEPKLFQPFFTTKPVGKGTGLGLSVSYGIIESYGGVIGYRANEWGGATFFFELPVSEPAVRPPSSSTKRASSKPDDRSPLLHGPVSSGV
jgi:C4-dicarboxylate-specific signal transduction histidine kinase